MVSGGAQKNLNAQIISNFKIPIPPLEEQERIVGILDKFDELVSDISLGIPAEIQMRKKQYYEWAGKWILFIPWHFPNTQNPKSMEENEKDLSNFYPSLYMHLLEHKDKLSNRNKDETGIRYEWYCLQRWGSNYMSEFNRQKIVWAEMTKDPSFIYNNDGIFINQTCYFIPNANKYHLAILNSKLIYFYMQLIASSLGEGAFRWIKQYIEKIPIPKINEKNQNIVDKIISLTDEILTLKEQNMDSDISEFDLQINRLVYELYELSEEEIAFVES
ncbi:restriction endonuclease subunit S [Helicobacter sp. faydin-H76]|uniref:site-specific DNA-methyltransferase (adenine-specific) n=1 Tax=Helicobacter cappadocius TaxID=3063998 RepID=A0AA90PKS5_9HELI|nr:restriction endonuclease subunit S [Helicobacter sp. faydin-H76]MDP2539836.1 restriction endonuclease subunit S [Helicobacter sp. faydin-H76]